MSEDEQDPMLFGNETEQANYRAGVMQKVRAAIQEDRASRRHPAKPESPATIIGATGLTEGLNQSL